ATATSARYAPSLHDALPILDETGVVHDWEEVISGEAMDRGPVMLSWKDVSGAAARVHEAYNVVIHEFVHKIDMRDGAPDGCPPLDRKSTRLNSSHVAISYAV